MTKKEHGGKRPGSGRPPIVDKKVTVILYLRQSELKAVGGAKKAREIAIKAILLHRA